MTKKSAARDRRSKSGFFGSIGKGLVFLWQHPLIITVVLIALTWFLLKIFLQHTFTDAFTCQNLFANVFKVDSSLSSLLSAMFAINSSTTDFICGGYEWVVPMFDHIDCNWGSFSCSIINKNVTLFNFTGLAQYVNPPLEGIRKFIVWSVVALFALVSFFLTIVLSRLRSVVKLILLNREEWKNFLFGLRTWAFLFLLMIGAFYYWVNFR